MRRQIWAKALLKSYKRLGLMEETINSEVERIANEFPSKYGLTTEESANRILKCCDKKVKLCKTKVIIDDILAKISPKHATVLRMIYIKGKSFQNVADYFGVSTRTIVRYVNDALQSFSAVMKTDNLTPNELASYYVTEFWMCDMYYQCLKKFMKAKDVRDFEKFKNLVKTDRGDINFEFVFKYEI
jgi:predicted DNA-binding protein (UPF0251 family)